MNLTFHENDPAKYGSVFEIVPGEIESASVVYRNAAADAFGALPSFSREVIQKKQWSLLQRAKRRLIIKEINPLALRWLGETFNFRLIYIVRHPGAVASSWRRMQWPEVAMDKIMGSDLVSQINKDHMHSYWSWHGAFQALTHKYVYSEIGTWSENRFRIVTYENLCLDPVGVIKVLFEFADLPWLEDDVERVLRHSSEPSSRDSRPYSTVRVSQEMPNQWRRELAEDEIAMLRDAYLFYEPPVYVDEW